MKFLASLLLFILYIVHSQLVHATDDSVGKNVFLLANSENATRDNPTITACLKKNNTEKPAVVFYIRPIVKGRLQRLLRPGVQAVFVFAALIPKLQVFNSTVTDAFFDNQSPLYKAIKNPWTGKISLTDYKTNERISRQTINMQWLQRESTISSYMRTTSSRIAKRNLPEPKHSALRKKLPLSEHWHIFQSFKMMPSLPLFRSLHSSSHKINTLTQRLKQGDSGSQSTLLQSGELVSVPFATLKPKLSIASPGFWWEALVLNRTWSGDHHYWGLDRASRIQCALPLPSPRSKPETVATSEYVLNRPGACTQTASGNFSCIIPQLDRIPLELGDNVDPDRLPSVPASSRTGGPGTVSFSNYPLLARDHFSAACDAYSVVDKISKETVAVIRVDRAWKSCRVGNYILGSSGFNIAILKKSYWPEWLYVNVLLGIPVFQQSLF